MHRYLFAMAVFFPPAAWAIQNDADAKLVQENEPTQFEPQPVSLQFEEQEIRSLAVTRDGKRLVVGHGRWDTPGLVRLWDLETMKEIASWQRPMGISCVAVSPEGGLIAAAGWDRFVVLYDIKTRTARKGISTGNNVARVAFSPDGKTLATATESAELKLWDVESGREIRKFGGDLFRMQTVCFSKDGEQIAAAGGSFDGQRFGKAAVWNVDSAEQTAVFSGLSEPMIGAAFSPDGNTLATSAWDRTVRLWDVKTGRESRTIQTDAQLESVQFSHDGKWLATTGFQNAAQVWDPASGTLAASLPHEGMTIFAAFSPDDKTLYTGGQGKVVRVWDTSTFKEANVLQPETGAEEPSAVLSVSYSPDGRWIATSHQDATVRLRSAQTQKLKAVLKGHEDIVSAAVFSPDSKTLATAGYDGLLKLWDVESGREKQKLSGHTNWIFSLAFSPDGKQIATGSYDKTARIWDETFRNSRKNSPPDPFTRESAFSKSELR